MVEEEQDGFTYLDGYDNGKEEVIEILDKRFSETNEIDKAEWIELKQKMGFK
jgi:hypothetical protein